MYIVEIEEVSGNGVFSIAVFGTCRVRDFWSSCVDAGLANVTYSVTGFTQTIQQASQLFQYINGHHVMPPPVQMLCYDRFIGGFPGYDEDQIMLGREQLESVDMFAIEISTKKEFVFEDNSLSIDRLMDLIKSDNSGQLLDWFSNLSRGTPVDGKEDSVLDVKFSKDLEVEITGTGKHYTYQKEIVNDIMNNTVMFSRAEDEVREQLFSIKNEFLKPIIAIPAPTFSEKKILEREQIVSILENSVEDIGFNIFNPSKIISEFGVENSMVGGGTNVNHYESEFLVHLGEKFVEYSQKIWDEISN